MSSTRVLSSIAGALALPLALLPAFGLRIDCGVGGSPLASTAELMLLLYLSFIRAVAFAAAYRLDRRGATGSAPIDTRGTTGSMTPSTLSPSASLLVLSGRRALALPDFALLEGTSLEAAILY